jgi:hypothetical protein
MTSNRASARFPLPRAKGNERQYARRGARAAIDAKIEKLRLLPFALFYASISWRRSSQRRCQLSACPSRISPRSPDEASFARMPEWC